MITVDVRAGVAIQAAADLIDRHGKAWGAFRDHDGALCPIGALRTALGYDPLSGGGPQGLDAFDPDFYRTTRALARYLHDIGELHSPIGSLTAWSDGHTASHVVHRMRQCAATLLPAGRRANDPPSPVVAGSAAAGIRGPAAAATLTPDVAAADGPAPAPPGGSGTVHPAQALSGMDGDIDG